MTDYIACPNCGCGNPPTGGYCCRMCGAELGKGEALEGHEGTGVVGLRAEVARLREECPQPDPIPQAGCACLACEQLRDYQRRGVANAWRRRDAFVREARREALEEAAARADDWAASYPVDIFPSGGSSLDAQAAGHGRTVARGIAKDIRAIAGWVPLQAERERPEHGPDEAEKEE